MASPRSGKQSPEKKANNDGSFVFHLIACGHGDTLLLQLPDKHWVLVDCNLKSQAVKDHFFELVEKNDIKRLEFLFLTHPHHDHYTGMVDVVKYFSTAGRSIGTFCDTGIDPVEVTRVLDAKKFPSKKIHDYVALMRRLHKLTDNGDVKYEPVHERVNPLSPVSAESQVSFVPIGPESGLSERMARKALEGEKVTESLNSLSVILLLTIAQDGKKLSVLLAGDAKTDGMERALKIWQFHDKNDAKTLEFDVVKVPHHGSRSGHTPLLCQAKGKEDAVSAISVDIEYGLPKRDVLEQYLDNHWTVVATTTRRPKRASDSLIAVFGKGVRAESEPVREDVRITWDAKDDDIRWEPIEAHITKDQLEFYPD